MCSPFGQLTIDNHNHPKSSSFFTGIFFNTCTQENIPPPETRVSFLIPERVLLPILILGLQKCNPRACVVIHLIDGLHFCNP